MKPIKPSTAFQQYMADNAVKFQHLTNLCERNSYASSLFHVDFRKD